MNSTASVQINYKRILALEIEKIIARHADEIAEKARTLVDKRLDERKRLDNNQLNGLEAIAVAANSVSQIVQFIERQTGRNRPGWRAVGPPLRLALNDLGETAKAMASEIKRTLTDLVAQASIMEDLTDKKGRCPRIHLQSARRLVGFFVSFYQYAEWEGKSSKGEHVEGDEDVVP